MIGRTVTPSDLNCPMRLFEIGASDHEFLAAHIAGTLDDIVQIVLMDLSAVILSPEHGIAKIDPDLDIHQVLPSDQGHLRVEEENPHRRILTAVVQTS